MPIYEYTCNDCHAACELLVRNPEDAVCPKCNSIRLEKQLSVIASPNIKSSSSLAMSTSPAEGGCGLPQCGQGRCQFD
jgi:putative FmdB family regulatory protein